MLNCSIGKYGEDLACRYLESKNYTILDRNYRNRFGEIDIICFHEDTIIFLEVKSRYTSKFGKGRYSVNSIKQKNIIKLSTYYIHFKNLYNNFFRFDVIEVELNIKKDIYNINHITDAFRLN
ncbi:MAG: YraN family protein [Clostridium sp.]